jgi:hypothetical protein
MFIWLRQPRFETGVNDGPEAQQLQQIFVTHLLCFYCTKYFPWVRWSHRFTSILLLYSSPVEVRGFLLLSFSNPTACVIWQTKNQFPKLCNSWHRSRCSVFLPFIFVLLLQPSLYGTLPQAQASILLLLLFYIRLTFSLVDLKPAFGLIRKRNFRRTLEVLRELYPPC